MALLVALGRHRFRSGETRKMPWQWWENLLDLNGKSSKNEEFEFFDTQHQSYFSAWTWQFRGIYSFVWTNPDEFRNDEAFPTDLNTIMVLWTSWWHTHEKWDRLLSCKKKFLIDSLNCKEKRTGSFKFGPSLACASLKHAAEVCYIVGKWVK